ncbi:MAG: hypothetical protein PF517_09495 [Salinivirgaceae bacterium]|jgi:hypothetical protein|nr:hypothetical protein [Salinivirgaceae bacterium]
MIFKKTIAIIGCLLWFLILHGQEMKNNQQIIEDLVEEIAENNENELDYSQITEYLYYFLENPINLNSANTETLERLTILNDFQIISLHDYIRTRGKMTTIYELQMIEGFDLATIKKVLPFINVSYNMSTDSWSGSKALKYGTHSVLSRISSTIEEPIGYKNVSDSVQSENNNKYYNGNRTRIYTRYKFNYKNKLQWGITAEKDPGEQFMKDAQPNGFDFYSAHMQLNDLGIFKTALLGDFQAQFGQGLIMWSYMSSGKSPYVMDIRKRGKGIHRYSSTDENSFLRGGGFTLETMGLSFTAFGSHKNIDANIQTTDSLSETHFSSFLNLGIHALPSEVENSDAIKETVYGGNLGWQFRNFKLGISGIKYQFNHPFKADDRPENTFRFSGASNSNASVDAELRFNKIHVFSEAALSENGGKAVLAGAVMKLSSQFRTSILYRNYDKEFQALYSNAFAEGSKIQNEQGVYVGAEMHPVKKWKLAGYYDAYKFPWLTSHTDAPSKGNDYLVQADFTASRTVSMYWRYKKENKDKNIESEKGLSKLGQTQKAYLRYQVNYKPLENWEFRNRLELSNYKAANESNEQGFMLYHDAIYKPQQIPLSMVLRYAVFDTESYNTRIYTYETDVLYAYSVPALYDKGTRAYIMLHYKLADKLGFWLSLSQTWYAYKTVIGSGLNQINGNTKSVVKFQVRWKL